jgi:hypothetical protein
MPTFDFTEEQTNAITEYSRPSTRSPTRTRPKPVVSDPTLVATGKQLFEKWQCVKCHVVAGKLPNQEPANMAPDLANVPTRLRADWIGPRWSQTRGIGPARDTACRRTYRRTRPRTRTRKDPGRDSGRSRSRPCALVLLTLRRGADVAKGGPGRQGSAVRTATSATRPKRRVGLRRPRRSSWTTSYGSAGKTEHAAVGDVVRVGQGVGKVNADVRRIPIGSTDEVQCSPVEAPDRSHRQATSTAAAKSTTPPPIRRASTLWRTVMEAKPERGGPRGRPDGGEVQQKGVALNSGV